MPEQPPDAATVAPKTMDQRFGEVEQAFLDQRDFTTFCFDKLRSEMRSEFADVRESLGKIEGRVGKVEVGLGRVERRLDRHEDLLGEILAEVKTQRPRQP